MGPGGLGNWLALHSGVFCFWEGKVSLLALDGIAPRDTPASSFTLGLGAHVAGEIGVIVGGTSHGDGGVANGTIWSQLGRIIFHRRVMQEIAEPTSAPVLHKVCSSSA